MSTPIVMETREREVLLGGEPMFVGSTAALLAELERLVAAGGRHLVVTPNVDQVLDLESSASYRDAFRDASLRLFDGMPLVLLARLLGAREARRHTGADLLPQVAGHARERGWRVVVTGGAPAVAVRAASALRDAHPGVDVVTVPFPRIDAVEAAESREVVERLSTLRPQCVFLCLGAPKQELWYQAWKEALPEAVYLGAGAAVDFAAGQRTRAPGWAQALALEWVWRLAQEPRRLGHRYLVKGPRFGAVVARSLLRRTRVR
jgi:N-acetylglucosaminyldiphosphoundecaprenol N-acetyl-beta-D-mannosaminyltransferase